MCAESSEIIRKESELPGNKLQRLLSEKMYIHYGHKQFLKGRFQEVKNLELFTKPSGGLWASDENAEYGWRQWCTNENFKECAEDNCFRFCLKESANVYHIRNAKDLVQLPKIQTLHSKWICLNFEAIKRSGIDAVELHLSEDWRLYWLLYGWDCDSILILNPDVVVEVMP